MQTLWTRSPSTSSQLRDRCCWRHKVSLFRVRNIDAGHFATPGDSKPMTPESFAVSSRLSTRLCDSEGTQVAVVAVEQRFGGLHVVDVSQLEMKPHALICNLYFDLLSLVRQLFGVRIGLGGSAICPSSSLMRASCLIRSDLKSSAPSSPAAISAYHCACTSSCLSGCSTCISLLLPPFSFARNVFRS